MEEIQELFGFPVGILPVRYLGVPLASIKLNASHYSPVIEKLASFTNKWYGKNLSFAGRVELITSVLQGIDCYWLQVFPLPSNVIDRISSISRNFLWGASRAPVAWKDCCMPKEEGGLGFRNLSAWNKALLSKTLWNIHSKAESLWIKWIHSEFIKQNNLWSVIVKTKDPPLIKAIMSIRDSLLSNALSDDAAQLLQRWFNNKGTSLAYEWFRPKAEKRLWPKFVWKSFIPPKYPITTRQAMRGRLYTRERLSFANVDLVCPLCLFQPAATCSSNARNQWLFGRR